MQRDAQPTLVSFFSTSFLHHQSRQCSGGEKKSHQHGDREGTWWRQETMNSLKFCSANERHVRSPTRKSEGRKFTELCTFLTSAAMASVAQLIYVEPELPLMMTCSFSCSCVKWRGLSRYQCCCCCCCDKVCFPLSFWSGFIWKKHKRNRSHFIRLESRSTELSGKYKHLTLCFPQRTIFKFSRTGACFTLICRW